MFDVAKENENVFSTHSFKMTEILYRAVYRCLFFMNNIKGIRSEKLLCFFISVVMVQSIMLLSTVSAEAAPPDCIEIFEAMIDTGANTTFYNASGNPNDTYHYVKPSVVVVHSDGIYGSGSIWEIGDKYITVVTNCHVIENCIDGDNKGKESVLPERCKVVFFSGRVTEAYIIGADRESDIAFLKVDTDQLSGNELISIRKVRRDINAFESLKKDDLIVVTESEQNISLDAYADNMNIYGTDTGVAERGYSGKVLNTDIYVTDMNMKMIYANCYAKTGMSGGGAFDSHGNYIGMLTGGSDKNEAVCIKLVDIENFYNEIESGNSIEN